MLREFLYGNEGGISKADVIGLSHRDTFSRYLPWLFYNEEQRSFVNLDNTVGYIWECVPLTFAGLDEVKKIEALLKIHFPLGTVMQIISYPDPYLNDEIARYKANKKCDDPLVRKSVDQYANFLQDGTRGLKKMFDIPVRNFRLFVTLKSEEEIEEQTLSLVEETLSGAHMAPQRMTGTELLVWMRRLFNGLWNTVATHYDRKTPLRKQTIHADTLIDFSKSVIRLGPTYAKCLTPESNANFIDSIKTNRLGGGFMGVMDDENQITTPYLWCLNILFDDVKSEIALKTDLTMSQRAGGRIAKRLQSRLEEFSWAADRLEGKQEKFVRIIPSFWVFAESEETLVDSVSRVKRIWGDADFVLQEESVLSKSLLIASLPFGLYNIGHNIKVIDRDYIVSTRAAARFAPIQGDYRGASDYVLTYVGRKGQLIGVDVFDPRSNNHNFVVAAESGSGKSFGLNHLCNSYFAAGALIRVADIGYSFEKSCSTNRGRFIDFGQEKVIINPFHCNSNDPEDRKANLVVTANILAQMAYSASGHSLEETEWTLTKEAVRWTDAQGRGEYGIDAVQEYLSTFPKYFDGDRQNVQFAVKKAHALAFNLRDFIASGYYGRFFNGKSTFDISSDQFVVLELDRLKGDKELFTVVVMQVMNSITQDLYLSDRGQQRFILFEEAPSFLKKNGVHDMSRLAQIIEEGYRRARKYNGSFGVVLQSILDTLSFGSIGPVVMNNAAYKFYLEGKDYQQAISQEVINYSGLTVDLLQSVKNNKPRYSEVFLDTPMGRGIARLAVDPWNYWVNTSDGKDVAAYKALLKQGANPYEALCKLSGVNAYAA